ncbi:MAG TPA: pyrroline-5-carboxylate reductase [Steroidobacteraceae bacterium]|nr:pyrroline-5-carboxylate reductase [Steroidobacteraceae bacterium]
MDLPRIAIVGGGHMGRALVGGLLRRGMRPEHVRVSDASDAVRASLEQDFNVRTHADNAAAIADAAVLVLAVRPQDSAAVLSRLAPQLRAARPLIVSVVAGIRIASLSGWYGEDLAIVRAMPNRSALLGAGATGIFAPERVSAAQRALAQAVMHSVGAVVWLRAEHEIDLVTALSGSGPAYFFLLGEHMTQAAIGLGLEPETARTLAVATLYGAGLLAHAEGDLARLRAEVASSGGTTEAALKVFAGAGLDATVASAMSAAARRARELAEQFGGSR